MIREKRDMKEISVVLFIGLIAFLLIFLILFIYKDQMISDLEREAFQKLTECIIENQGNLATFHDDIRAIAEEFEKKRQAIDHGIWLNSITGFFITAAIIFTSLSKVVKNIKSMVTDLMSLIKNGNGKKKSEKKIEKGKKETEGDSKRYTIVIPSNFKMKDNMQIQEIMDLINQFNDMEKNQISDERQALIEKIIGLLMERLVQILGQAAEINHDREQLTMGIHEIKKGIEHITQKILENGEKGNGDQHDEIIAAVAQMHAGIEEMGFLLMQMEDKLKKLSSKMENQKE
ncbi:hypothetical protein [Thermotalea metallivorans]|uniref:Uncharacterized protein n=1 Tax=Thermotalea metallivorans TaxID=520762 RepID=A0A140L4F2_9FIRM|nr:hypothetical protein [Thermotalea metallivorans]KXG75427.1 hypothetical protein AN619_16910 [Thermotalea metallivorans]